MVAENISEVEVHHDQSFTIPMSHVPTLETMLEKANRRLQRAGADEQFTVTIQSRIVEDEDSDNNYTFVEVADITLNTPTISVEGYSFLAVMTREEQGFIVRTATDVELDGWRPQDMLCDHCETHRARKTTYLISTPEGEYMQIGSLCVKPLLGFTPAGLWALMYNIDLTQFEGYAGTGGDSSVRIKLQHIIALALTVSDMGENFITRSAISNGYEGIATADSVTEVLFGNNPKTTTERHTTTLQAEELIKTDTPLINNIINSAYTQNPDSDYEQNMNILMESEWVSPRNIGFAVSAVGSWVRAQKKAQQETIQENPATPEYVAEPRTKLQNLDVTVHKISNFESTDYMGAPITRSRVAFRDNNNRELLWWASRIVDEIETQDKVTISSARVKDNTIYHNTHQTIINYVRLQH